MNTPTESKKPGHTLPPPSSLVGSTLSERYRVDKLVGEGGMGTVYLAEHMLMRKRVAIKVLHPEMTRLPEVVARFEREAMAAAHIEHPNVAAATDFGKLPNGAFFLVLEYVEGTSLRQAIAEGPMETSRAVHIAEQIASALGRAHQLGIVHRDLKPDNVMLVTRDDDADFVKVLDFGIAKVPVGEMDPGVKHSTLTQSGMVYGTPEYMSPEQALGQSDVDGRADLYALGVILFEMLTGSRPFDHESKVKLLGMHLTSEVPSMKERGADVPAALDSVVHRLMSKDAKDRFDNAKDVLEALDFAMSRGARKESLPPPAGMSIPTPLKTMAMAAQKRMSPRLMGIGAAIAGGFVLLVIVVFVLGGALHGGGTKAMGSGSGAASSGAPPKGAADYDADLRTARALAQHDPAAGATALEKLASASPDRPEAHADLFALYTGQGNAKDALRAANHWTSADPKAKDDERLLTAAKAGATSRDAQDDAFTLLEGKLGPKGVDVLYDLAYGTGVAAPVATRAQRSLAKKETRDAAGPATQVVIDLRNAHSCDQKHAAMPHAEESGDERALAMLTPMTGTRGCGFANGRDCNPCLRDGSLTKAIAAIKARVGK